MAKRSLEKRWIVCQKSFFVKYEVNNDVREISDRYTEADLM